MTPTTPHAAGPVALETLVLARITSLLADRRWYRKNRWAAWTDLRREGEVELRALVRLAREARRLAPVIVIDHPPGATVESEYAAWTEGELVAGFGK